jgi:D-alanyl-lipoteichoic acid acyltransferase DltB (MBOAT superfamily)
MSAVVEGSAVGSGAPRARQAPWSEAKQVAFVALQLLVALLLAQAFGIEHASFHDVVLPLAIGGFLVHHWLPRSLQAWFFVALSVAGIFLVFGAEAGAWLTGAGLALIGLCHVPVAHGWRLALVLAAAGALVGMRAAWLPTPWPGAIWPVLGSMFMFRLGIYLYDLRHESKPAGPAFVLSYFLMLPNTVFLLFPVIDWQTFRRTYFDRPAPEIYGEGVRWIFRGLVHLVLYRVIYQNAAISPADADSTAAIVQYLVANFGLYLRVSGQFHVIVGLLHLFGFRLPESHRFFYLASSFTDLWRRINIYWKDFMQKMVYLPVFFAVKRRGETTALVLATLSVVVVTWTLHSYQWFWLLGTWLMSATDAAFWGLIGVFLLTSTLLEQRRGRVRQLGQKASPRHGWAHALQTAGMFGLMALLWGLWTSPTFADFGDLLAGATLRPADLAVVLGTLGVVAIAAWVSQRYSLGAPSALGLARRRWQQPLLASALPLACFWYAGDEAVGARLPGDLHALARNARDAQLNVFEAEQLQRGYYEEIVGINRFNGELWEVYAREGARQAPVHETAGQYTRDRWGNRCFRPHSSINAELRGFQFTSNRWGLRDRDYELEPGPATRRMAILGPSLVLGSGVGDGEPFEQVIEDRLNRELSPRTGLRYESLNFGLPRATLAEVASLVDSGRVGEFAPDVVLVVSNIHGLSSIENELVRLLKEGEPPPAAVARVVPAGELAVAQSEIELKRLLYPHGEALLRSALAMTADAARRMGAQPVFALIPMPYEELEFPRGLDLLVLAREAGFIAFDLRDVYDGHPREEIVLSDADHHPNTYGHRVIAHRLYADLTADAAILGAP